MVKIFILLAASLVPSSASAYNYHYYTPHYGYRAPSYGCRPHTYNYYVPRTYGSPHHSAPFHTYPFHSPSPNFYNWHH